MTQARIAYVINSVEGGGAALPVPAIARVLQDCGAQVRVFALTRRDGRALPPMERAGLDPLVRDGGERDHLQAGRWLMREARAWCATHLWTSLSRATILGLLAGPRMGLPVIAWQHAALLKPWNRRLLRALQGRARLWVADSASVARLTRDRLNVTADRLETWPIFAAEPDMPVASAWVPGAPLRIGSLGRLHHVKGYDILLEALSLLRRNGFVAPAEVELAIAGEGSERERLLAVIRAQALPVSLPGYEDNPRRFLHRQHLYVQPSRSEGFCIAVHEALNAGLPVIATRVGEPAHTIRNGVNGWLAAPGDALELAQALRGALRQPQGLAGVGRAGREDLLLRFSPARFAANGRAIWERAIGTADQVRSVAPTRSGRSS